MDTDEALKTRQIMADFRNPRPVKIVQEEETAEKQLRLMFHVPGSTFSGRFVFCWTATVMHLAAQGHYIKLWSPFSPNLYDSRNMAWGGDWTKGKDQKPFQGEDYDFCISIDSDQYWTIKDIDRLIEGGKEHGFFAGIYLQSNRTRFATILRWDGRDLNSVETLDFKNIMTARDSDGLIRPAWTGFGFMIMRKGILESIDYPWIRPIPIDGPQGRYWLFDDHAFHYRIQRAGHQVVVDPSLRVGHEKLYVV